ncbi:hypothetical protein [Actinomadura nitritigenes]|uniref:hypothetical protein n=1 Tax=Actinomadura nitritigenes TaxID=134602 RepID=UPI003D94312C
MSTDDTEGQVLRFPRAVLPPPARPVGDGPDEGPGDEADEGGAWFADDDEGAEGAPEIPDGPSMAPPVRLAMPSFALEEGEDGEDGAFTGPHPEDPDAPGGTREAAAVGMAVMTAFGVAAAQGMWHRARQRAPQPTPPGLAPTRPPVGSRPARRRRRPPAPPADPSPAARVARAVRGEPVAAGPRAPAARAAAAAVAAG